MQNRRREAWAGVCLTPAAEWGGKRQRNSLENLEVEVGSLKTQTPTFQRRLQGLLDCGLCLVPLSV